MAKQTLCEHDRYLQEVNTGLELLWDTAKRIVDQVLCFRPDVVVCLLHSGWAPLKAALMLWEATQVGPFPAIVKTNLGREKFQFYQVGSKSIGTGNFLGHYSEPFQIGHFLAWLSKQSEWQAELKEQIEGQLSPERVPERIMIVDDWVAEGNTYILALGLLNLIYPQAETHFVAGVLGWKVQYDRLWLKLFYPDLHEKINLARDEGDVIDGEIRVLINNTMRLMLGTEDTEPFSLDWRPITAASSTLQKVSKYLPAEEWLDLPKFVDKTMEDYIAERIVEYQRGKSGDSLRGSLREGGFFPKLSLDIQVLRDLWLDEGGIKRCEIIEKYHLTPAGASRLLRKMMRRGLLVKVGHGRSTFYILPPDAYLDFDAKGESLLETYWVVPGRLLVGDSPRYLQETERRAVLQRLFEQGVDTILDLSGEEDYDEGDFEGLVQEEVVALGKHAVYRALTLPNTKAPKRDRIKTVLDSIDQALAGGKTVFVGCGSQYKQSGMVAGCYLARHGLTGKQSLQEVERLRAHTTYWWLPSPALESQRRLVRGWQVGE
jgi:hypothetical protein